MNSNVFSPKLSQKVCLLINPDMNKNKPIAQDYIEKKRSQALRLNEPELREFERKLHDAYILKEQQCQIKEKEYERIREEILRKQEAEISRALNIESENAARAKLMEANKDKADYNRLLHLQMNLQREKAYLQRKDDDELRRKENENVSLQMQEDNLRKLNERMKNIAIAQNEREIYKRAKEIDAHKREILEQHEKAAIEEFNKYQAQKEQIFQESIKEKAKLRDEIYDVIAAKMLAQQKEAEERQKLISELQEYEYSQKRDAKREDEAKLQEFKMEIIRILKSQIAANLLKEKKLRQEELEYRKHLAHKQNVFNQLENERRILEKLKAYKYAADIQAQMEMKRQKTLDEQKMLEKSNAYLQEINKRLRADIEREKLKLAREYGSKS